MITALTIAHWIFSLALIVFILLHAGRGGLSDMFGGGVGAQSSSGSTVQERNLDRVTIITAVVFGLTTVSLTWLLG